MFGWIGIVGKEEAQSMGFFGDGIQRRIAWRHST
jgi:hypothetical protein